MRSAENKTNAEYRDVLGAAAARLGDASEVARVSRGLAALPRSYSLGVSSVAEARLAATGGRWVSPTAKVEIECIAAIPR